MNDLDLRARTSIGRATTVCMSLSARPGVFGSRFHNHLYAARRLDWIYRAFSTTDLPAALGGVRALGIRGCAISMPFKEAVLPLLDRLDGTARAIDSVNTIVNDDGVLTGYNTDFSAVRALVDELALPRDARVVVHGAGGMAKAVVAAVHALGFRELGIVARNEARGRALAAPYGGVWSRAIDERGATLLINATPLGMLGAPEATALAFPTEAIDRAQHVFDVVAVPTETPLVRAARAAQKSTTTGDRVLVLQAVEQFALYTGQRPTDAEIAAAATYALAP